MSGTRPTKGVAIDHTAEHDAAWRELLNAMVDKLKADGMLTDPRVEHAMRTVPRHEFLLEEGDAEYAYTGELIRTLAGADGGTLSTASQVTIVALMLQVLDPQPGENVLEVGLGTGYNAGLLAHLVGTGHVTAIDNEPSLVRRAIQNLARLSVANVTSIAGDGWLGHEANAPYDALTATVSLPDISPHWMAQLREGGRIVAPMWISTIVRPGVRFVRSGERLVGEVFGNPNFVMLRGRGEDDRGGWVLIDGAVWSLPEGTVDAWQTLKQLLAEPPSTTTELPELDRMWPYWVGLEDPNVCTTYYGDDPRLHTGLFDQHVGGLVIADGKAGTVRAYGDASTLERFMELLFHRRPQSAETLEGRHLTDLRIDAVPHGSEAGPEAGWLIQRPSYDFLVTVKPSERS